MASSTARNCLSSSSLREDFFAALALAAAFSKAALDGGMTWALGLESLEDFFSSPGFLDDAAVFEDFSVALDFLDFSRDDVDELDEYELSEPESLESDEPEPEELDRRLRFSVETLRGGEDFFRFVDTAFSIARLSGTGETLRFFATTGDTLRTGEYLPRLGLALGDRVLITFLTCVVWRSLSFDRWLSYRGRLVLGDGERLESELDPDRELLLELLYEELLL